MEDNKKAEWIRAAVDQFSGPLTRYAQVITGDLEQARDAVQDTFIRLCDEKPANRALDAQRKQSRTKPLDQYEMNSRPSPDPSPAAQAEQRETDGEVMDLLARLPKNQQEVVRLKFQNGLSYREISEITHLSVSNVGFLIHTAIKTLRQQMKPEPIKRMP